MQDLGEHRPEGTPLDLPVEARGAAFTGPEAIPLLRGHVAVINAVEVPRLATAFAVDIHAFTPFSVLVGYVPDCLLCRPRLTEPGDDILAIILVYESLQSGHLRK